MNPLTPFALQHIFLGGGKLFEISVGYFFAVLKNSVRVKNRTHRFFSGQTTWNQWDHFCGIMQYV